MGKKGRRRKKGKKGKKGRRKRGKKNLALQEELARKRRLEEEYESRKICYNHFKSSFRNIEPPTNPILQPIVTHLSDKIRDDVDEEKLKELEVEMNNNALTELNRQGNSNLHLLANMKLYIDTFPKEMDYLTYLTYQAFHFFNPKLLSAEDVNENNTWVLLTEEESIFIKGLIENLLTTHSGKNEAGKIFETYEVATISPSTTENVPSRITKETEYQRRIISSDLRKKEKMKTDYKLDSIDNRPSEVIDMQQKLFMFNEALSTHYENDLIHSLEEPETQQVQGIEYRQQQLKKFNVLTETPELHDYEMRQHAVDASEFLYGTVSAYYRHGIDGSSLSREQSQFSGNKSLQDDAKLSPNVNKANDDNDLLRNESSSRLFEQKLLELNENRVKVRQYVAGICKYEGNRYLSRRPFENVSLLGTTVFRSPIKSFTSIMDDRDKKMQVGAYLQRYKKMFYPHNLPVKYQKRKKPKNLKKDLKITERVSIASAKTKSVNTKFTTNRTMRQSKTKQVATLSKKLQKYRLGHLDPLSMSRIPLVMAEEDQLTLPSLTKEKKKKKKDKNKDVKKEEPKKEEEKKKKKKKLKGLKKNDHNILLFGYNPTRNQFVYSQRVPVKPANCVVFTLEEVIELINSFMMSYILSPTLTDMEFKEMRYRQRKFRLAEHYGLKTVGEYIDGIFQIYFNISTLLQFIRETMFPKGSFEEEVAKIFEADPEATVQHFETLVKSKGSLTFGIRILPN
ncbi:hypothetical protein SNEBB_005524 [Seison nebaliae]|nr:hypothetical protein SNEBB_005524 [Seison nebaliae]